ncbi:hypothetical protein BB559_007335, partial [Furculomyces boomerangus]
MFLPTIFLCFNLVLMLVSALPIPRISKVQKAAEKRDVIPSNDALWGMTYSPYKPDGTCPDNTGMLKDLLSTTLLTNNIRLYSTDCNQLQAAVDLISSNKLNIGVYAGIWVSNGDARTDSEIAEFVRVANQYKGQGIIKGVSIGNEELFQNSMTEDQLIQNINKARAAITAAGINDIPIYTTDTDAFFSKNLADACDLVQINVYSIFDSVYTSIADSVTSVFTRINTVQQKVGSNKLVRIGETGYPSAGNYNTQQGSIANQLEYVNRFVCNAKKQNLEYFVFEAKDALWKT